jgi:hypothetical protein
MIEHEGFAVNQHLAAFQSGLRSTTRVKAATHSLSELLTLLFREQLWANLPAGQLKGDCYIASRSDLTYHIALAIQVAAGLLRLTTRFEAMGRLDAVIETLHKEPRVVLLAEWEWDYQSVFGPGQELDKLWSGLQSFRGADALLFTYCLETEYFDFAKRVVQFWQDKKRPESGALSASPRV